MIAFLFYEKSNRGDMAGLAVTEVVTSSKLTTFLWGLKANSFTLGATTT